MNKYKNIILQTFSSLSVRNYRLYFMGQAVSLCGTWMQTIAQDWLILKLTNSGTQLGFITAAQFLPVLLFGAWGGLIADRFPKRKILYFTQSAFGVLAILLGILVATNTIQIWMIYVCALLMGLVTAVDHPTRQAFVFEMVGEDKLSNALTLNNTQFNLARVIGPSIGGVLIAIFGLAPSFIINGVSYAAILILLSLMRKQDMQKAPIRSRKKGQLMLGFRYILSSSILINTFFVMAVVGTLSYEFSVILPLFAKFTFQGNAATYATLTAAMGIGSVFGGIMSAGNKNITGKKFVISTFMLGATMVLAALMPNLFLATLMLVLVGLFTINFISQGNAILQLESSPEMRGRVMSLWTVAYLGSTPIGGPIIGFIGQHVGPRWGLAVGGLAAVLAALLAFAKLRKLKSQ